MKNTYHIVYHLPIIFLLISMFSSCKHKETKYHSVMDKIEAESKPDGDIPLSYTRQGENMETIEITEGDKTFLIPARKNQIASYACTECHTSPLRQMQSRNFKKAHWDITLVHANANTMNCITCHDSQHMNKLISITGKSVDFDRSYQLCSQCHTRQFEDWKGGAHGKRMEGWVSPRVSMTCVNCHNPHTPHYTSRWPARFNTKKLEQRE